MLLIGKYTSQREAEWRGAGSVTETGGVGVCLCVEKNWQIPDVKDKNVILTQNNQNTNITNDSVSQQLASANFIH